MPVECQSGRHPEDLEAVLSRCQRFVPNRRTVAMFAMVTGNLI